MERSADPLSTDHRRYGLATPADRTEADEKTSLGGDPLEEGEGGAPEGVRKHMSAYERRVQKKVRLL